MKSLPVLCRFAGALCLAAAAVSAVPAARADDRLPPPVGVAKDIKLAHKSVFESAESQRSPFWPIGWKPSVAGPAAPAEAPREVAPEVTADTFVVTTISLQSDGALAVINGRTHGVGDRLPVDASGREFVIVRQIVDGAVVFEYHGKLIRSTNNRRK